MFILIKDVFFHVLSIFVMANVNTCLWKLVNSTIPYHDVTSTVKPLCLVYDFFVVFKIQKPFLA